MKPLLAYTMDAPTRRYTRDSSLAYLVNQLENLDKNLYEPLVSVSWGRDIKLRPGITMSNESTSFIRSAFGGSATLTQAGGTALTGGNMPWVSPDATTIPGISINGQKVLLPLRPAAREVTYTSLELERSQLTGQPIDVQKVDALNLLYQMSIDQMVYIGDSAVGATGLLNDTGITEAVVAAGATGSTLWVNKTADEILYDVNYALEQTWSAAAFAICPSELRLPPAQYTYICSQKVSSAGNVSIMKFLEENSIALKINGKALNIQPIKWLTGQGTAGDDRMLVYTNDQMRVRYPMVPIRRETAYYQGMRFTAPYLWLLGQIEFVYPETVQYWDGI